MDVAIWKYAKERSLNDIAKKYTKLDDIPFDYKRRMLSVIVKKDNDLLFITKGAPESVLKTCEWVEEENQVEPIDDDLMPINSNQ